MNRHDLFIISSDNHEEPERKLYSLWILIRKMRYTIMTSSATETKHSSITVVQRQLRDPSPLVETLC